MLSELLYADDLVLMSETIEGLRDKFLKWKEAFECRGLKVSFGEIKGVFSSHITQDSFSRSKVDPCRVGSLRVKTNSVLCVQSGRWIHGRCTGVKWGTPMFSMNFTCSKYEGNVGEALELNETLCDEVKTLQEFTYLGERVSACEGCEAAVTARTSCVWVWFRQCTELLNGRFPLMVKGAVYRGYVR